jgi:hypothetical protein
MKRFYFWLTACILVALPVSAQDAPAFTYNPNENFLAMPPVGGQWLRVLSPTVLEVTRITTKQPDAPPAEWDFVDENGKARLPEAAAFQVMVNQKMVGVERVGFKRRPLYAPLARRDLRIGNYLYLELGLPVPEGATIHFTSAILRGELWTIRNAMLPSPALHVNQIGYAPSLPKSAFVGYYLGSLGELEVPSTTFQIVVANSGQEVFSGPLKPRRDEGYTYAVKPYQQVFEADFSALQTPGVYRLKVSGLGVSLPFLIYEGVPANFARAYALGLYHQRCGVEIGLPFSRFTHAPCHTAPADVPTTEFAKTQAKIASMTGDYKRNPRHAAPQLKSTADSLYPFVRQGKIDASGGHHDAGDYSKYTINSAQLIHHLVFAADAFPGVAALDNLGLPESGDGKSDVLQIAKWEADFLAKLQDDDGGFYFLVYPRDRAYEGDVPPDKGDPQVVFPKTTSATAAAVAALAQAASSPTFRRQFPGVAKAYLEKADRGWNFLQRAIEKYGRDGSYQKITHYGDTFMHDDELAWAATEIYLAMGDKTAHEQLLKTFDPASRDTIKWGWVRLFEAYGCAIRSYAFAARSGRTKSENLDAALLRKCEEQILLGGQDAVKWSRANAYGTSFPTESKRFRNAGWYFSIPAAFEIAVAAQLKAEPEQVEAILGNVNFEGGANPNNVAFLTGIGYKRQREIVHQWAQNDRRVLPPSGIPLGAVQEGFPYLDKYKKELGTLTFPSDGDKDNAFAFYDRWGDTFNVATEFVIVNQARGLATLAWLMAQTPQAKQPWRAATAKIIVPATAKVGEAITAKLQVESLDLSSAQIVWEALGEEPRFARDYTFTPRQAGAQWIEAEAVWPDGRRTFATVEFEAK